MEKKIEYKVKHVGVNTDSPEEARKLVQQYSFLFGLEVQPEMENNIFAGDIIEVMKHRKRGACGHIALQTPDVEAAMEDLRSKGITFQEDTIRRDEEGKIKFIYLHGDIGGFSFHLTK